MKIWDLNIPAGSVVLPGQIVMPTDAESIVLFAHGSGSSRHSRRNQFVAVELQHGGMGTLLFDLLTAEEEAIDARTAKIRFDIPLLAQRLLAAVDWLAHEQAELALGLFGASTGAAAALIAAAQRPEKIAAVVSRGGRPDLAGPSLPKVQAPTLLIVGQRDEQVIELNRAAFAELRAEKEMKIVPRATHLFEEPGALAEVAHLARDWFAPRLTPAPSSGGSPAVGK